MTQGAIKSAKSAVQKESKVAGVAAADKEPGYQLPTDSLFKDKLFSKPMHKKTFDVFLEGVDFQKKMMKFFLNRPN